VDSARLVEFSVDEVSQRLQIVEANLQERIAELEYELEERGWERLSGLGDAEFSRDALRRIAREARLFIMKNPLIRRAVELENAYVFGQGVTIEADLPLIDAVVQAFIADELNRDEISSPRAMAAQNTALKETGNLFLCFFTNDSGDTRVRTIPFDEIQDVISNPEDAREPWYYLRQRITRASNLLDIPTPTNERVLHPDWQYTPAARPESYQGVRIDWEHPVYHVSVNRLHGQRFGLSEIYAAQDWARAYNEFLANWATITRSLARFTWKVATKGGPAQRSLVKGQLDSGISSDSPYNPAPSAASAWIETEGATNLQPVKTAGATTSPQDGRRLLLMVCAAMGFPETFFGDAEVGTLATAKSLDRPTELAMQGRQRLWAEILENVLAYAIERKARAGIVTGLSGHEEEDAWDELKWFYGPDPEGEPDEPINTHVSIDFPDIVERDVAAEVGAIVQAATLGGQGTFAGTLDPEYTTRRLLLALGEQSVEEVMEELFPEDEEIPAGALAQTEAIKREMKEFLTLLKEARVAE